MIKLKNNQKLVDQQAGFTTLTILIAVLVLVAISGIGIEIASHNKNKSTINLSYSKSSPNKTATKSSASATESNLSTQTTSSTSPAASTSTSTKTTSTTKAPASTTKSTTSSPLTTSGPPAPAATTLSTLASIISGLQAGQSANVTASNVSIPGPIGTASGRPIVFSFNGVTYFAYTQEQKPNLNQSASSAASTFAIVSASGSYTTTTSHLDKSGNLVDQNEEAVGYSTGGN